MLVCCTGENQWPSSVSLQQLLFSSSAAGKTEKASEDLMGGLIKLIAHRTPAQNLCSQSEGLKMNSCLGGERKREFLGQGEEREKSRLVQPFSASYSHTPKTLSTPFNTPKNNQDGLPRCPRPAHAHPDHLPQVRRRTRPERRHGIFLFIVMG